VHRGLSIAGAAAALILVLAAPETLAKGEGATAIAAGEGAVWVGTGDGGVWRIDPPRARPRLALQSPTNRFIHGLAVRFGSLWMVDGNALVRADRRTGRITGELALRGRRGWGYEIAVARGSLWIGGGVRNVVYGVRPKRPRVVARIRVPGRLIALFGGRGGPWLVAAPASGAVTGPFGERIVYRLAPRRDRLVAMRRVSCDVELAAGAGVLWEADVCKRRVLAIDPTTGRPRGRPIPLNGSPTEAVVGFGALWVVTQARCSVQQIDVTAQRIVRTICARGGPAAAGAGALWLVAHGAGSGGSVVRIDPRTGNVGRPIRIPAR
jgi:streptogramin lyase